MIPEAIAIVCAPSYNEYFFNGFLLRKKNILKCFYRNRIFILVPDYGVKQISECRANGFHPHQTNPPLFEVI